MEFTDGVLHVDNFLAATLGATGAFLVSRYLARRAVERKLEGDERFAAIDRAVTALKEYAILGVTTNVEYLISILQHPAFAAGKLHTGFLDEHLPAWSSDVATDGGLALAVVFAVGAEALVLKVRGRPVLPAISDYSAVVTALLFALKRLDMVLVAAAALGLLLIVDHLLHHAEVVAEMQGAGRLNT